MDYSTLPPPPVSIAEAKKWYKRCATVCMKLASRSRSRREAGKRYSLAVLIGLLCRAEAAGQTTLKGATEWVRLRAEPLAASFGLKRTAMPCQMTYKRILDGIDAQVLNELLSAFFTRLRDDLSLRE